MVMNIINRHGKIVLVATLLNNFSVLHRQNAIKMQFILLSAFNLLCI